jgi:hypothetical protein
MIEQGGVPRVGDTVKTVEGESRDAFSADFFDGLGVVSGYRNAASERPLVSVEWTDSKEFEALETALVVVELNEDVYGPLDRWEKLAELRLKYPRN